MRHRLPRGVSFGHSCTLARGRPMLKRTTIDGLVHSYREAGAGSPLVLIPGIQGSSRFCEPQLAGLADQFRVIAWDPPGAGDSDDPDEFIGIEGYADCLAAFLRAVDAAPAHVGGLSWGGVLALEFYRRHPELVASLLLIDTYAGWKGSLSPEEYAARRATVIEQLETQPPDFKPASIPGVMHPDATPKAKAALEQELRDSHPAGWRAMARALLDVDARDVLPTITVPTVLIWGEADERAPLPIAEAMRDAIPGAQLFTIPGAGHMSSLEQPDAFNRTVREFYS